MELSAFVVYFKRKGFCRPYTFAFFGILQLINYALCVDKFKEIMLIECHFALLQPAKGNLNFL